MDTNAEEARTSGRFNSRSRDGRIQSKFALFINDCLFVAPRV
jgi:hypothetical protein